VKLLSVPGVHDPVSDTWLLAEAMQAEGVSGREVADLCCGSGALAIAASRAGARSVLGVDISLRATLATRLNAWLNGCSLQVRRGDLFGALGERRFDVIVCNPPYVPSETDVLPRHRRRTALDAGRDGRALIDRICRESPAHLSARGCVLVVHSSVCDSARTLALMERAGLQAAEVRRVRGPLGPVLRARAPMLRANGLLCTEDREDLVVVRGRLHGTHPVHDGLLPETQIAPRYLSPRAGATGGAAWRF
jgi:release factor glutamine methyltransferase